MKTKKKSWGVETIFVNNELYCMKEILCHDKWSSNGKFHYHKIKDETFVMSKGILLLQTKYNGDVQTIHLKEDQSFRIAPGILHRFKSANDKLCIFLEVSTHHEDSDSYYEEIIEHFPYSSLGGQ